MRKITDSPLVSLPPSPWRWLGGLALFSLLAPADAYAYLDPASGSILLQALAAGALAGLFMIKRFWAGITDAARRFWSRLVR